MCFLSLFCASLLVSQRGLTLTLSLLQGVTKGLVAEKVLSSMISDRKLPDFVMCIGDDRSDEDMFESISTTAYKSSLPAAPEIFACTVGQKPSKARYYLDDTVDVVTLLQGLATASSIKSRFSTEIQVSFQNTA
jgi:trehalose 6-phosphate synthase/phosphatase